MSKKISFFSLLLILVLCLSSCAITGVCDTLGHYYKEEVVESTCLKGGYTKYTCRDCGHSYTDKETVALGHDLVEFEEKAPSCLEEGNTAGIKCSRCDYKENMEIIPALGHNIVIDEAIEPTCTKTGLTQGEHCIKCDYVKEQEIVPTVDHKYVAVVTEPTCLEKGYTTYTCECSHSYVDDYVKELGHDIVIDKAIEPTCTKTGLTQGEHCTKCDYVKEQEIVPVSDEHDLEWEVITNATSDTDGIKQNICTVCEKVIETGIVPATNPSNLAYTVNSDGLTCKITGMGECTDTQIVIPSYIDGYKVTIIGSGAFYGIKTITSVVMQDSVETIDATAFSNCSALTKITLSKNITKLGTGSGVVFANCKKLISVYYRGTIENWCNISVAADKANPMYYATNFYIIDENGTYSQLTDLVIPNTITTINKYQFSGFDKVTSLTLSDSVETLGIYSFKDCTGLTTVKLSSNLKNMYMGCFYNCGFKNIELPESVITLGNKVFQQCKKLETIQIPSKVEILPEYVLYQCTALTSVIIPTSVKTINNFAFNLSTNLKNVYYMGSEADWNLITVDLTKNSVLAAATINYNYSK